MAGDGEHRQAVAVEDLAAALHVRGVGDGLVDLEVVAPAGDLEAVVPPLRGLAGDLLEREIGELAGEEGDGAWHEQPPADGARMGVRTW
jgi:hypothetical protein